METKERKKCFVISPIGEKNSEERRHSDLVLKHIIEKSVNPLGYEVIRADKIAAPGIITVQIMHHVIQSELVIADLTTKNPNVFYELALRHVLRKPVIHLMKKGEKIPFDVQDMRTILFDYQDPDSLEEAKEEIATQIKAIENGHQVNNLISLSISSIEDGRTSVLNETSNLQSAPAIQKNNPVLPHPAEPEMVSVEGGTFWMGDEKTGPLRRVTVNNFKISKCVVTQRQWQLIMDANVKDQRKKANPDWPLKGEGDNYPIYYVSWEEAVEFCNKLSEICELKKYYNINKGEFTINSESNGFRLPTEAEWEYAARGGSKSKGYRYSGSDVLKDVGWFYENSGNKTNPVKQLNPNELGIFDMSGNVWEWCEDWYDDGRSARVLRGGSWYGSAGYCSVADRGNRAPGYRNYGIGFRLAVSL